VSFIRLDPRRGDPPLANTSSAKKRIRQNEKRRLRNRSVRSAVRGSVKSAREALGSKAADSTTVVAAAIRAIDRAVTKGIMHRNTAARRKSSLARKLNAPA
jgi:small subunit ribosomal protein S20